MSPITHIPRGERIDVTFTRDQLEAIVHRPGEGHVGWLKLCDALAAVAQADHEAERA